MTEFATSTGDLGEIIRESGMLYFSIIYSGGKKGADTQFRVSVRSDEGWTMHQKAFDDLTEAVNGTLKHFYAGRTAPRAAPVEGSLEDLLG